MPDQVTQETSFAFLSMCKRWNHNQAWTDVWLRAQSDFSPAYFLRRKKCEWSMKTSRLFYTDGNLRRPALWCMFLKKEQIIRNHYTFSLANLFFVRWTKVRSMNIPLRLNQNSVQLTLYVGQSAKEVWIPLDFFRTDGNRRRPALWGIYYNLKEWTIRSHYFFFSQLFFTRDWQNLNEVWMCP